MKIEIIAAYREAERSERLGSLCSSRTSKFRHFPQHTGPVLRDNAYREP